MFTSKLTDTNRAVIITEAIKAVHTRLRTHERQLKPINQALDHRSHKSKKKKNAQKKYGTEVKCMTSRKFDIGFSEQPGCGEKPGVLLRENKI